MLLCLSAERAALADFGLDFSCCCSTSANCFSRSAFFIANSLSLCSFKNSVRFLSSSGSILDSANASAMDSTCELSFFFVSFGGNVSIDVSFGVSAGEAVATEFPVTNQENNKTSD